MTDFADAPKLPEQVRTLEDAIQFIAYLYLVEELSFHPDTPFFSQGIVRYWNSDGVPAFSEAAAQNLERLRKEYWRAPVDQYNLPIWVGAWFKFYPPRDLDDAPPEVLAALQAGFPRKQDWSPREEGERR